MRTRDIPPSGRGRVERPPVTEQQLPPYVPDRDLTVYRDGISWKFLGGKILVDGHDLNRFITHNPEDVGHWLGLAEGLDEYRKKVLQAVRASDQFTRFEAVVEALLGKILGRLKKVYDQKISGLSWSFEDGQLILNGINIRSFLALYRIRKTEKAKKFLMSLRERLKVLLENRRESPDYERVHDVVAGIYREMDEELVDANPASPPRSVRPLLSDRTGGS